LRSGGKSLPASSESPRSRHCDVPDASTGPSAWAHGKVRQRTRPSKRPLPIHSTRCATYAIVVTVASPVTTRTRTPGQLGTGPSRRPGPTGRCRHRAHRTPAAHCRQRFAHRSGHSRSTAPDVLLVLVSFTTRVPQASCRTVPSAWADGPIPASGPRHARGPLPSPIRPSKRPLPIHSTRCASYTGIGPRDGTVSLS
jgi:hypothetical protein